MAFGAGAGDNRNIAAQAGDAAARAASDKQKQAAAAKQAGVDPSVLERIVAEEREAKGKMPRYPGLERWTLVEKMGDGAFSNVYRARDTTGQWGEVAIKVVRKFEMNSQQVSITPHSCPLFPYHVVIPFLSFPSLPLRRT
ncbi:MAPK-activated protein kinase Srk1 [Neocucurbitaria cava]|uniref:MAPK-activated protein kinase Srk1 n=1 Tax=Neocucurbitaria cava TaxID=798079 RepID=A0A9W8Y325_9PLEO|nr:MAPK-activated protein kinase Srk1 [Neocucurbitaria cava]